MLRAVISRLPAVRSIQAYRPVVISRCKSSSDEGVEIKRAYFADTEEDFDQRYIEYFNNPSIDNWQLRTGINNLVGNDVVPEPTIIEAALRACRRLDDHSAAVRILEAVRHKCEYKDEKYGWVIQELRPVLQELSISTPEEMGYHEPELWLEDVFEMHGEDEPKSAVR